MPGLTEEKRLTANKTTVTPTGRSYSSLSHGPGYSMKRSGAKKALDFGAAYSVLTVAGVPAKERVREVLLSLDYAEVERRLLALLGQKK